MTQDDDILQNERCLPEIDNFQAPAETTVKDRSPKKG